MMQVKSPYREFLCAGPTCKDEPMFDWNELQILCGFWLPKRTPISKIRKMLENTQMYCYAEGGGRKKIAEGANLFHAVVSTNRLAKLGSKIPKGKGEWI